jgi:hypothetical protein
MERVIAIFSMIIGVTAFYFVVSDINTIISNSVAKEIQVSACMTKLDKIKKMYPISSDMYKAAKLSLFNKNGKQLINTKGFLEHFPRSFGNELKFHMYSKKFELFKWTRDLPPIFLGRLGDVIREVELEESKSD